MNSNQISIRITDLLKLTGLTDMHTIEELTDHYLTHIEEEIIRGVNAQQAVRETFQEIANIDRSQFSQKKKQNRNWILLLSIILLGLAFYFCTPIQKNSDKAIAKKTTVHDIQLIEYQ